MPRLLVVHHTPSPALQEMFEAAVSGARTDEIEGVDVVVRPALTACRGRRAHRGCLPPGHACEHWLYVRARSSTSSTASTIRAWRRPGGGPTDCTCTAAWTPPARCARWSRSPPGCSGEQSGRRCASPGTPGKADLEACWELGALLAAEVADLLAGSGWGLAGAARCPAGNLRYPGTYVIKQ